MAGNELINNINLGNDAAETDRILSTCFIETRQFREALSGQRRLILGRKGTGKTAIYRMLADRLNSGQQTVVPITPSKIFWGNVAKKGEKNSIEELTNLWEFSIYCRIFLDARLNGLIENPRKLKEVEGLLRKILGVSRLRGARLKEYEKESIFGKIWASVSNAFSIQSAEIDAPFFKIHIDIDNNGAVPDEVVSEFRFRLNDLVPDDFKVRVLFDQLDEYWDGSEHSRRLLISLMVAILNIIEQFPDRVIPTVFMRTDIWELINFVRKDRFPMYETTITWSDEDLIKLVCERIRKSAKIEGSDKEIWRYVFEKDSSPANRSAPGYIINRTFKRPRDVLYFVRECIIEASSSDISKVTPYIVANIGREKNSRTLTDNLVNELIVNYSFINDVLSQFRGKSYRLTRQNLAIVLRDARRIHNGNIPRKYTNNWFQEKLFEWCVLGVANTKSPIHTKIIYHYSEQKMDIKNYKYFFVHPGLRAHLGCTNR